MSKKRKKCKHEKKINIFFAAHKKKKQVQHFKHFKCLSTVIYYVASVAIRENWKAFEKENM